MDGQLANKITGYGGKEAGEPVSSFVKARRRRGQLVIALLLLILLLTLGTGVILGAVKIRLSHLVRALRLWPDSGLPVDDSTKAIIIELRLPRALLAAMVGAALALAGACFQASISNPWLILISWGHRQGQRWGLLGLLVPSWTSFHLVSG